MANIETQTRFLNIVFSAKYIKDIKKFQTKIIHFLDNYEIKNDYALILHNRDINLLGEMKIAHIHCVVILERRQRIKTFLTRASDNLGINIQAISIQKCNNVNSCMQYLIHLNDKNKTQYDISEIKTNISSELFATYFDNDNDTINFDNVARTLLNSRGNLLYVIKEIGFTRYGKYRNVIQDMLNAMYDYGLMKKGFNSAQKKLGDLLAGCKTDSEQVKENDYVKGSKNNE